MQKQQTLLAGLCERCSSRCRFAKGYHDASACCMRFMPLKLADICWWSLAVQFHWQSRWLFFATQIQIQWLHQVFVEKSTANLSLFGWEDHLQSPAVFWIAAKGIAEVVPQNFLFALCSLNSQPCRPFNPCRLSALMSPLMLFLQLWRRTQFLAVQNVFATATVPTSGTEPVNFGFVRLELGWRTWSMEVLSPAVTSSPRPGTQWWRARHRCCRDGRGCAKARNPWFKHKAPEKHCLPNGHPIAWAQVWLSERSAGICTSYVVM